jgi:WhiB family transcriptional regulator, redox-sensing transcriptional regulator
MNIATIFGFDTQEWMSDPARNCAKGSPDAWFPTATMEAHYAERLCTGCPQSTACLAYALANPELDGIWGGTTYGQRNAMRKGDAA